MDTICDAVADMTTGVSFKIRKIHIASFLKVCWDIRLSGRESGNKSRAFLYQYFNLEPGNSYYDDHRLYGTSSFIDYYFALGINVDKYRDKINRQLMGAIGMRIKRDLTSSRRHYVPEKYVSLYGTMNALEEERQENQKDRDTYRHEVDRIKSRIEHKKQERIHASELIKEDL